MAKKKLLCKRINKEKSMAKKILLCKRINKEKDIKKNTFFISVKVFQ
jgi:hypothetical protein